MTNRKNIDKLTDKSLDAVKGGLLPAVMPSALLPAVMPTGDSNTIYISTATGGVWK